MSYSEPLVNQFYRFALSVGFGILAAIFYEFITCIVLLMSGKRKMIFARDIVFSVLFTVSSFFFMLVYNEGEARFNLIFGHLLGIAAFHFSLGKMLQAPFLKISDRKIFKFKKHKKNKK